MMRGVRQMVCKTKLHKDRDLSIPQKWNFRIAGAYVGLKIQRKWIVTTRFHKSTLMRKVYTFERDSISRGSLPIMGVRNELEGSSGIPALSGPTSGVR